MCRAANIPASHDPYNQNVRTLPNAMIKCCWTAPCPKPPGPASSPTVEPDRSSSIHEVVPVFRLAATLSSLEVICRVLRATVVLSGTPHGPRGWRSDRSRRKRRRSRWRERAWSPRRCHGGEPPGGSYPPLRRCDRIDSTSRPRNFEIAVRSHRERGGRPPSRLIAQRPTLRERPQPNRRDERCRTAFTPRART